MEANLNPTDTDTTSSTPQVPQFDRPETPEDVIAAGQAFAEFRKEVAALREELRAARQPQKAVVATHETLEERTATRLALIAQHEWYCPGCGALFHYQQKCSGGVVSEFGHPPLEVVSTSELAGDPALHTAAPDTELRAA